MGCDLRIWAQCDPVSAGLLSRLGLEPLPVPIWRPRDALPLDQLPSYISRPYREAAARLAQLTERREEEAMSGVIEETSNVNISEAKKNRKSENKVLVGNTHEKLSDGKHKWW